jgi:uncharacterized 2Fe-2S/4Fe-4S cluster protein (DUF4445 family)
MTYQADTAFRVDFEPIGRRAEVVPGETLLAAAQAAGVGLVAICGGAGVCGDCRVRLVQGELSSATGAERELLSSQEREKGFRLACQAVPLSDVKLDIPPESLSAPQRLQVEGQEVEMEPDPWAVPVDIEMDPPSLHDLRPDYARLQDAVEECGLPRPSAGLSRLIDLSEQLRTQGWNVRLALRGGEIVAVLPRGTTLFGLAVDIGTTKLATYLVELAQGKVVAKAGAMNPQIAYGEDVVSRIAYTNQQRDGRKILQEKVVSSLNDMVVDLCAEGGIAQDQIVEAVVVGNTAMHHLFAGLPVQQLGMAPYVPAVSEALDVRADEVGLVLASGGYVHLPPNIAGYVGADHVAMLLASGLAEAQTTTLALDIGTNTEISLAVGGRLLSCSCASGPAFEGAHIHDGMRAAPGAIERVHIVGQDVHLHTIADELPVGICGSGILDAVAEMREAGILDRRGAIQDGRPQVRSRDGKPEFILAPAATTGHGRDVVVNRKDVNEVQLAKAAIRAGIEILLAEAGISAESLERVIIAGAFGTYLDVSSAIRVGMLPQLPIERFRQVGNAAGAGARQMLISGKRRLAASQLIRRIEYIELTIHPGFTAEFLEAMYL